MVSFRFLHRATFSNNSVLRFDSGASCEIGISLSLARTLGRGTALPTSAR